MKPEGSKCLKRLVFSGISQVRGGFGGQTAGGHPKAFPRPGRPLFAVPALRELESACRVIIS